MGASENLAVLNVCFDFFVIKAPSDDDFTIFKMYPPYKFHCRKPCNLIIIAKKKIKILKTALRNAKLLSSYKAEL